MPKRVECPGDVAPPNNINDQNKMNAENEMDWMPQMMDGPNEIEWCIRCNKAKRGECPNEMDAQMAVQYYFINEKYGVSILCQMRLCQVVTSILFAALVSSGHPLICILCG